MSVNILLHVQDLKRSVSEELIYLTQHPSSPDPPPWVPSRLVWEWVDLPADQHSLVVSCQV